MYPKGLKTGADTCTPVSVATLFTGIKRWKQLKCPSVDRWANKMWYVHTMECYSATKLMRY